VSLPPIKEYPHIFGPDEYEWAEQISAGFLSQFGSGRSVIDAMSDQSAEQDDYVQDTQGARVIASDEAAHTADVVMFADEVCLAHQELTNDPALLPDYFALDANPANSPRHMAWRFTAGHNAIPKFLELQLRCQSDLAVVAAGRAWVAIYRDNGMGTAPGALLVTMDSRVGARIPNSTWILCLLWADWEVTLVAGTRYWIAVCTSDPMGSGGQWGTTDMWVRRRDDVFPLFADPTVMDTASDDFPSGGAYSSHVDRRPWFRLYECRHTLNDVPMAENATAPSRGELVSMRRIQGMHPQREIIGPFAGQTAGRIYTTPRTGGGAGSFQIFTPGSIPFAGASGVLTEDNPNLFWDDAANRLGIGTNAPATALHVYGAANIRATIEATDSASYAIYVLGTDNSTTAAFITAYGSTHAGQANELAFKNNYGLIAFYPGTAGATTRRMALTNTPQLLGSDGVVASPFYSFATELGMGMYRVALNQLGLAAGGVLALTLTNTPQALLRDGTAALPGLAFGSETALGIGRAGAGTGGLAAGGAYQWYWTAGAFHPVLDNTETLGIAGAGIAGLYFSLANAVALLTAGEMRAYSVERSVDWSWGQQIRGGGRLTTKDTVASFDGAAGNFDSGVIASGSFARRKTWSFRASGQVFLSGAVVPTIDVQLHDTVGLVASLVSTACGGGPAGGADCAWQVEGMITEYATGEWAVDGWKIAAAKRTGPINNQDINQYVMGGTVPVARNAGRNHFIRIAFTNCQAVGTTYCYQLAGGVNVI